ncbi:glycosyltransferase family 2 protein, partial [Streptomyces sp. L7]
QENSGWPGRPRNVGIDLSGGKYVQFVDQDDELSYEALERLYALAERNGSDIVLGKVHGTMQGPSNVFKRTVERCTAADAPLFESLTPHKMFRRDFLHEHGIRKPRRGGSGRRTSRPRRSTLVCWAKTVNRYWACYPSAYRGIMSVRTCGQQQQPLGSPSTTTRRPASGKVVEAV